MRHKDINGQYTNSAIGYCHCSKHQGALTSRLAYKHKCIAKRCKHLEIWSKDAFRCRKYRNRKR